MLQLLFVMSQAVIHIQKHQMENHRNLNQVILAEMLTGVQGDIWCKVLAALSTVK